MLVTKYGLTLLNFMKMQINAITQEKKSPLTSGKSNRIICWIFSEQYANTIDRYCDCDMSHDFSGNGIWISFSKKKNENDDNSRPGAQIWPGTSCHTACEI